MPSQRLPATLALVCVVVAWGAAACSLDRRHLHGAAEPGDGDAGQSSRGGDAGSAGASSGSAGLPGLVDGCADLDTDGVADCSVTLLENPSFDQDVASWQAVGDAELSWAADNALADRASGSARLLARGVLDVEGSAFVSATQCLPLAGKQLLIAYANARVERDSDLKTGVRGALQLSFFDSSDCSGERTAYFDTPPTDHAGEWLTIQAGGITAPTTASVSVALVGLKPYRTETLAVGFDNLMLKAHPL